MISLSLLGDEGSISKVALNQSIYVLSTNQIFHHCFITFVFEELLFLVAKFQIN